MHDVADVIGWMYTWMYCGETARWIEWLLMLGTGIGFSSNFTLVLVQSSFFV